MLRPLPQLVPGNGCFKCCSCFSRTEWHEPLCFLLSCHFSPLLPLTKEGSQCASTQCSNIVFMRRANYTFYRHLLAWHAWLSIFDCFCLVMGLEIFTDRILDRMFVQKHLKFICTWVDVASVDISSASHLLLFEDSLSNNCVFPHSCTKTQQRNVCSFFVYFHFCSTSPYWLMVGCCFQDLWLEKTPVTRFPIRSYSRLWVVVFFGFLLRFLEELLSCSTCSAGCGVVTPLSCCGCVFCASGLVETSQLLL